MRLVNVQKSFDDVHVLRDIHLDVYDGAVPASPIFFERDRPLV